eukprot:6712851-Ditylum_brightwellii.AAC.1
MTSFNSNSGCESGVSTVSYSVQKTQIQDKKSLTTPKESLPKKSGSSTTINEFELKITFCVGASKDIKAHDKFALLPSLIIARFPTTTLE